MKQTVVGVFDSEADAQRAMQTLAQTEVDASHVRATYSDGTVSHPDAGLTGRVRNFFSDMFSADDDRELGHYAEAVRRGGAVVRVDIDDDDTAKLERVRHVLQDAGAVDLDERVDAWRAQGWSEGEDKSAIGTTSAASGVTGTRLGASDRTEEVIPVVKEELAVGKRAVSTGGVRVYARAVETPVSESVQLRTEHAEVERRPVDRPATAADLAHKDRTLEVRETAEQPVVKKTARVVEEVRVGKTVEQRTEQVRDTVRSTEVEVERLADRDIADSDAYFRKDYAARYGSLGGRYEDYEPAYRYGHSLASDPRYAGRSWDEFEADARRDWESRYPGSAWERMKAAVRHGWERVRH